MTAKIVDVQTEVDAPRDLTKPTPSYRRHVWLAVGALLLFVVAYVALTTWFGWMTYRLVLQGFHRGRFDWFVMLCACAFGFFAVFLVKGLFFIQRGADETLIEMTATEQPKLFAALERLARETGAPFPHKVFLSPNVNAAVFYDLSPLNLLIPSRKNLVIGLGLVNAVTVSELRAVLAHEFGHFAQRSMAVGRWVYTSQQIAAAIIARRDVFDRLLHGLSETDFRVAWIGWLMRVVVWSLRALLESVFGVVVLAQRAMSREMEFNADLVSVSVTGSDALIHALHKLRAADGAWDNALGFVADELDEGRVTRDIFDVQLRFAERVATALGDEQMGSVPPLPEDDRASHRVFEHELGEPPKMWSTHPPNRDREDNAKRVYVAAELDERSAWSLFDRPKRLRRSATAHVIRLMVGDGTYPQGTESRKATRARIDESFNRPALAPHHQGVYLGRSPVRQLRDLADAYGKPIRGDEAVRQALDALYADSIAEEVKRARDLHHELEHLHGLERGFLEAPGGVIRHRGRTLRRSDLPAVIAEVQRELEAQNALLCAHDRDCRTAHRAAATARDKKWSRYLRSLLRLLHYATHTEANIVDAAEHLQCEWNVAIADGHVSSAEIRRLVESGDEVHSVLKVAFGHRKSVRLTADLRERLAIETWADALPDELDFPPPSPENIGDWLEVSGSWIGAMVSVLGALRLHALDSLLDAEAHVARCHREGIELGEAPKTARTPDAYDTLVEGQERQKRTKLGWWDRFQTADGLGPEVARLSVAAGIIGAVVLMGHLANPTPAVTIYNPLGRDVTVRIGDVEVNVDALAHASVESSDVGAVSIRTATREGEVIESMEVVIDSASSHYVYNAASASPLVEWTARYTSRPTEPKIQNLGAERWVETGASYVFEEPPERGELNTTSVTIQGFGDNPWAAWLYASTAQRPLVALAHARWDELDRAMTHVWLDFASGMPGLREVIATRLARHPLSVPLLRLEQDLAAPEDKRRVCDRQQGLAGMVAADLEYVRIRCEDDELNRAQQFIDAAQRAPDNAWLALGAAVAHAGRGEWARALSRMDVARSHEALRLTLAVVTARVRRAAGSPALDDLASVSPVVLLKQQREDGAEKVPKTYAELNRGALPAALASCEEQREGCRDGLVLIAASDGAEPGLVRRALALAPGTLEASSVWFAWALARRENRDATKYERSIAHHLHDGNAMIDFVEAALRGDVTESRLAMFRPFSRGLALGAALVLMGDRARPVWRDEVRAILFADERPYFAPAR